VEEIAAPPPAVPSAPPAAPAGDRALLPGLVALATLAALLVLPFWVVAAPAGGWEGRLASFKAIALALTAAYFVAGTVWMRASEARRGAK
jgi:hypothetical protein